MFLGGHGRVSKTDTREHGLKLEKEMLVCAHLKTEQAGYLKGTHQWFYSACFNSVGARRAYTVTGQTTHDKHHGSIITVAAEHGETEVKLNRKKQEHKQRDRWSLDGDPYNHNNLVSFQPLIRLRVRGIR